MFYFLKDQSGSLFAYSLSRLTLGLKPVTISALVLPDNYSGSVPCCARLVWINLTFLCVWFFVVVVGGLFYRRERSQTVIFLPSREHLL